MTIHKKSSASILPITNNEQGISSSAPVPENHQQHENRSPALHASSNNKSICNSQGQEESLKNNMLKFSSHWLDKHWKSTFHTPRGVKPNHRFIVSWLGRIGFTAKGIVYAVMGGLCIATAQHLKGDITGTESPMGAFVFLGLFSIGTPVLIVMFVGILFYSVWRFWEGLTGQGYDALRSHFGNFFRARLSPIVSGIVYIVYLVYIGKLLTQTREERMKSASQSTGCFPSCWASSNNWLYRMAVGVFGVAFVIAFITQAQNGFSNRWHKDLKAEDQSKAEKYIVYTLGHLGFLARAGVFMFVAAFMFKTLRHPTMTSERDAFSDAINQIISVHGGFIGLWFLGIGLILFGAFAILNSYYKYFPTPPASRHYVF
ncbi:hypothetical protein HMPREF1544_12272 [Mucor circinelloides 1006PhL]|uniref:DUF1206 domain-containing protein n=1 Tax=Mucor circinelloides f. circinelloides (strain 1006PhL) TaxID=1220926 RepID=S2JMN8_MUCC1|nr:hypothetical protein HMPREF1544_12272 [Mucor circinelloides 1006PhL]KAG1113100.1 hypothetical protein G6F42_014556 [Rhizopus arrhizus]